MTVIDVSLGARSYPVMIGDGLLSSAGQLIRDRLGPCACAVVTDDRVGPLWLEPVMASLSAAGIRAVSVTLPHGEASKSLASAARLYHFLAEQHITRADALVALGGGVMGDLGGFAAATWLRGIRFVQLPTSLLAQVDSSVGGKVAVDLPEGKNLVGAFHQPSLVLCDPSALSTLPDEFWRDGMGEVVKTAAIRDAELFRLLEEAAPLGREGLAARMYRIVPRCVRCKADIVSRDEKDTGERIILNFGHTVGHAVEACQRYEGLHHGEAVAVGMSAITALSEARGLTAPGTLARLNALLDALGLPRRLPPIPPEELLAAMRRDKKAAGSTLRVVLLREIGSCFTLETAPEAFFARMT